MTFKPSQQDACQLNVNIENEWTMGNTPNGL